MQFAYCPSDRLADSMELTLIVLETDV